MADDAGIDVIGMACMDDRCDFRPVQFKRRAVGDYDVQIESRYCGVSHTDLHFAKNDLGSTQYPLIPGHEVAGVCVAVGPKVTKFAVGDHVGVGCFVDSCLTCRECKAGNEQFCARGLTMTYASKPNTHGRSKGGPGFENNPTAGGYSSQIVVHEHFVIKIPKAYPLEMAGPLMCAGITMYDPLKYFGAGAGTHVGIMGLGGLGIMGVKLAKALGCEVTVLSRSERKRALAVDKLGADRYVAMSDKKQLEAAVRSVDLLIDTIAKEHEVSEYMPLLASSGKVVLIGVTTKPLSVMKMPMVFLRLGIQGSFIGGIRRTQEVVDLCASEGIYPEIKIVPCQKLNAVIEALNAGTAETVRYVLDLKGTLTEEAFAAGPGMSPAPDLTKGKPEPTLQELKDTLMVYVQQIAFFVFGVFFGMMLMYFYYKDKVPQ